MHLAVCFFWVVAVLSGQIKIRTEQDTNMMARTLWNGVTQFAGGNSPSMHAYNSSDLGATWNEVDAAHAPNPGSQFSFGSNTWGSVYTKQGQKRFLLATGDPDTVDVMTLNGFVYCIPFNISSDGTTGAWGTPTADSPMPIIWPHDPFLNVTWRKNGAPMIVYFDSSDNGTKFSYYSKTDWTALAGGTWSTPVTLFTSSSESITTLWYDDATDSCIAVTADGFANAHIYVIRADNSVTSLALDTTQIGPSSICAVVAFQSKIFVLGSPTGAGDIIIAKTDSVTNPTTITYAVTAAFLDGAFNRNTVGRFVVRANGASLAVVWEVLDTRTTTFGDEMSSVIIQETTDGTTWTSPSIYFAPAQTDGREAGDPTLGAGHTGATSGSLETAADTGGYISFTFSRHYASSGLFGSSLYVYNKSANQDELMVTSNIGGAEQAWGANDQSAGSGFPFNPLLTFTTCAVDAYWIASYEPWPTSVNFDQALRTAHLTEGGFGPDSLFTLDPGSGSVETVLAVNGPPTYTFTEDANDWKYLVSGTSRSLVYAGYGVGVNDVLAGPLKFGGKYYVWIVNSNGGTFKYPIMQSADGVNYAEMDATNREVTGYFAQDVNFPGAVVDGIVQIAYWDGGTNWLLREFNLNTGIYTATHNLLDASTLVVHGGNSSAPFMSSFLQPGIYRFPTSGDVVIVLSVASNTFQDPPTRQYAAVLHGSTWHTWFPLDGSIWPNPSATRPAIDIAGGAGWNLGDSDFKAVADDTNNILHYFLGFSPSTGAYAFTAQQFYGRLHVGSSPSVDALFRLNSITATSAGYAVDFGGGTVALTFPIIVGDAIYVGIKWNNSNSSLPGNIFITPGVLIGSGLAGTPSWDGLMIDPRFDSFGNLVADSDGTYLTQCAAVIVRLFNTSSHGIAVGLQQTQGAGSGNYSG